jgi:hypothetical protein
VVHAVKVEPSTVDTHELKLVGERVLKVGESDEMVIVSPEWVVVL